MRLGLRGHRIWPGPDSVKAATDAAQAGIRLLLDFATAVCDPVQVVIDRDGVRYREVRAGIRKEPAPFQPPKPKTKPTRLG